METPDFARQDLTLKGTKEGVEFKSTNGVTTAFVVASIGTLARIIYDDTAHEEPIYLDALQELCEATLTHAFKMSKLEAEADNAD